MAQLHIPVREQYYSQIEAIIGSARNERQLYEAAVEAPFHDRAVTTMLGLGIVVLLLVDAKTRNINRIAISKNEMTQGTFSMTTKPFHEIKIPLDNKENYIAIAIRSGHYMITSDWQYLFTPELSPEDSRFNQAGGGIACSAIYPLKGVKNGGALIFSFYEHLDKIGPEHHKFMKRYAELITKATI
jgi:hypothetical protein